jgi:TPR repeat protein
MAADQGVASAQSNYGLLLDDGDGIPKNKKLAAHYYKLAADQGHAASQLYLALLLVHGDGIPQNMPLGAQYMMMSARQGNPQALQMCQALAGRIQSLRQ